MNYSVLDDENGFKEKKKVEQGKRNVSLGMGRGCRFRLGGQSWPPVFLVCCSCNDFILHVNHLHKLKIAGVSAVQLKAEPKYQMREKAGQGALVPVWHSQVIYS